MRISIKKLPININRSKFIKAAKFYINQLISDKIANQLIIYIEFIEMDEGDYAEMGWLDDNLNPREFYINISHKLKWKNILISLAHEIIHIKQHVKREVFDYLKQINISRWKNKKYNIDIVPYEKRPWEIEAARLDSVLYRKFLLLDIPRSL